MNELWLEGGVSEWRKRSVFLLWVFLMFTNSEQVIDQVTFEIGSIQI